MGVDSSINYSGNENLKFIDYFRSALIQNDNAKIETDKCLKLLKDWLNSVIGGNVDFFVNNFNFSDGGEFVVINAPFNVDLDASDLYSAVSNLNAIEGCSANFVGVCLNVRVSVDVLGVFFDGRQFDGFDYEEDVDIDSCNFAQEVREIMLDTGLVLDEDDFELSIDRLLERVDPSVLLRLSRVIPSRLMANGRAFLFWVCKKTGSSMVIPCLKSCDLSDDGMSVVLVCEGRRAFDVFEDPFVLELNSISSSVIYMDSNMILKISIPFESFDSVVKEAMRNGCT